MYLAGDQASVLKVTDKLITREYDFDLKVHKDSLGNDYSISGDTILSGTDGTEEKISMKGDTVIQHINRTDTLFAISGDNVLKRFKGNYFLNQRYADNAWEVKRMSVQNGRLIIGKISAEYDLEKLKDITATTMDTVPAQVSMTRKQFKKFLQPGGFADREIFTRMVEGVR